MSGQTPDGNSQYPLLGVSSADDKTAVAIKVNPTTGAIQAEVA